MKPVLFAALATVAISAHAAEPSPFQKRFLTVEKANIAIGEALLADKSGILKAYQAASNRISDPTKETADSLKAKALADFAVYSASWSAADRDKALKAVKAAIKADDANLLVIDAIQNSNNVFAQSVLRTKSPEARAELAEKFYALSASSTLTSSSKATLPSVELSRRAIWKDLINYLAKLKPVK